MDPLTRRLLPSTTALVAFDAVARLGSFSAGAKSLNLTQGALSRQIALLEQQLGVTLFERTNRGIALTERGKTYAAGVADIIQRIRTLSLETLSGSPAKSIGIAVLPTMGTRWLLPRISDFVGKNPDIIINFATRIGHFDFRTEQLDAAIHIGAPDWPGAECNFLMGETVAPVCSPAFLAKHPIEEPSALLKLPLLEMASRPGAWRYWFSTLGLEANHRGGMRFEQFISVAQACIEGLGVALMPTFLIASELESGQLVQAFDWRVKSPSSYYLVTPRDRERSLSLIRFSDWLIAQANAFDAEGGDSGG
ncbi:LysR family transcriptional regulator [Oryzicola mucosus]|uniref:LysR family transcriptional regulator n=1 Tax=Oryzicola mucosus TaxID=2767425 RepID=A0A8J6PPI6_9HYPH|nr:LysR family transcriptional regulator [Oryzicola mucosus]MBD0415440.1 LysR family transcriptional regulator [Oryzicola mucosus]